MSAANFQTMENFPLLVGSFMVHEKKCPVCGTWYEADREVCESCGEELEDVVYEDEQLMYETMGDIQERLNDLNRGLLFHEVSVQGGHYYGVQFYVEEKHDPNEYDNEDCHYYFDMYRSVAIRRYASEINKICRMLRRLGAEFGFVEMYCRAVFGNGEAIYERCENTSRSRIRQAVSPLT
ncbi:MAG: hypothetical protein NC548_45275 [Lachnospiraceae bacterium]|nr:hypothetical protein [Lachnospiraceae bacterium]